MDVRRNLRPPRGRQRVLRDHVQREDEREHRAEREHRREARLADGELGDDAARDLVHRPEVPRGSRLRLEVGGAVGAVAGGRVAQVLPRLVQRAAAGGCRQRALELGEVRIDGHATTASIARENDCQSARWRSSSFVPLRVSR